MIGIVIRILVCLCFSVALPRDVANADTPPKVGVILPMTGDLASFGKIALDGIKASGIAPTSLIVEDDGCLPARSVTAYQKLVKVDKVRYIIGLPCGSPQQAVAPLMKGTSQLLLVPASAAGTVHGISGGRIFSVQYSNEDEARFNAAVMKKIGAKKVAAIFYEDVFTRTHEKAFRENFDGVYTEGLAFSSFDPEVIRPLVLRLKTLGVDGIYVPDVSPFLLGLRTEMARAGLGKIPVVSIFSVQMKDVITSEGKHADGIIYSYPAVGGSDAIGYFPRRAGELLKEAISACDDDSECALRHLRAGYPFDENGVLRGEIETRTIAKGEFVKWQGSR